MNMRIEAQISLENVEKNIENLYENLDKSVNSSPKVMAVIKADGYGHGAVEIAKRLEKKEYIGGFAVATIEEAAELRSSGIEKLILILGYVFPESFPELVRLDIRPAVFKYETAKLLSEEAVRQDKTVNIHIKLDTGMGRIGYVPSREAAEEIKRISQLPSVHLEGIFTHFARADMTDKAYTHEQIKRFSDFCTLLSDGGVDFDIYHCENSAGIIRFPGANGMQRNLSMVRSGITTYGMWPSSEVEKDIVELFPVMRLVSHIAYIKEVPEGTPISYGGTFVTEKATRVATIPAGYADGVPRSLSNAGEVLIAGRRAKILGRVCMDQFMVDVTDIPEAKEHDEVVLIGSAGNDRITFEEWEQRTGLLNYELACHISARVPRVFI